MIKIVVLALKMACWSAFIVPGPQIDMLKRAEILQLREKMALHRYLFNYRAQGVDGSANLEGLSLKKLKRESKGYTKQIIKYKLLPQQERMENYKLPHYNYSLHQLSTMDASQLRRLYDAREAELKPRNELFAFLSRLRLFDQDAYFRFMALRDERFAALLTLSKTDPGAFFNSMALECLYGSLSKLL